MLLMLPGLLVGFLAFSRIGRLLQLFIKSDTDTERTPTTSTSLTRLQVFGVFAFVLSWSGLIGALAYYFLTERGGSIGWFWFFLGIAATPLIIFPAAMLLNRRRRRWHAEYDAKAVLDQQDIGTFDYEITFDEAYIRTLIRRYLRQLPTIGHPLTLSIVFTVAAVVIWVFELFGGESVFFAIQVFVMGILGNLLADYASRKVMFSDLGYASHMGKTSIYRLSAKGLEVEGPRPCHKTIWPDLIEWPSILRAARFRDGILLCGFGGVSETFALAWLPDSALHNASTAEVSRFVEERMQPRTIKKLK